MPLKLIVNYNDTDIVSEEIDETTSLTKKLLTNGKQAISNIVIRLVNVLATYWIDGKDVDDDRPDLLESYLGGMTVLSDSMISSVGSSAFCSYPSLTTISLPNATSIGSYAFQYCSSLTSINLPAATTIGNYAFGSCSSLTTLYIGMDKSTVCTLGGSSVFYSCPNLTSIYVPLSLVNSYKTATNWSSVSAKIVPNITKTTVETLSITADDVSGRDTHTTIHYTALWNTEEGPQYEEHGDAQSAEFPQNTSKTDTIQRTITFTLGGKTATTIITQGVWLDKSYSITLSGIGSYPWSLGTISNPDPTLYDGVYQSENISRNSTQAVMKIDFVGYDNFVVYIRSYAESNYDYTIASTLDATTYPTSYTDSTAKANTRGKSTSYTSISSHTKVEYPNDGNSHFIYVVFRKDTSGSSGDDRGYALIEK